MNTKHWYQSRTIWINVISVLLEVINGIAGQHLPIGTLSILTNVGNILLRLLTTQAINDPTQAKPSVVPALANIASQNKAAEQTPVETTTK